MKAEIVISPSGEVTVITREGTFAEGTEKISALLEALKASGVAVGDVRFEQHRHDREHETAVLRKGVKPNV